MFEIALQLMKALLLIALPFAIILLIPFIGFNIYWRGIKKLKPKKGSYRYVGYGSKIKRIFWDFPNQYVQDCLNRDPDEFHEKGVHIIEGEQGDGKTLTACYLLMRYKKMYPKLRVKTNYNYKFQDDEIRSWRDVVASENGIYGEINVLDEIQNWFNSLQSKNFPPEMMTEITQQRKQRKCIIGTSQVFNRVAKPIREQTYILYSPTTLLGCLTVVRKYKPVLSADGTPDSHKFIGVFFYVHSKELRESYDTYHKIEKMAVEGFKSMEECIA
jgi:ATP-dependent Clp protease ATP-binding subunit ClpX